MIIKKLKISAKNLSEQLKFYTDVLGLEIEEDTDNFVSFKIGNSILKLEYCETFTPYHFAINIPSNKELDALKWLKKRVKILMDGSNEIQNFESWNAKAIYFYDKDKNIVEFIARKNLTNKSDKEFDHNSLLEISEIGLATHNIEDEFKILNKQCDLEIFSGDLERFCAIGNDKGLIICINKNGKCWFPTNDIVYSSDFYIEIINNKNKYQIEYENEKLKITNTVSI